MLARSRWNHLVWKSQAALFSIRAGAHASKLSVDPTSAVPAEEFGSANAGYFIASSRLSADSVVYSVGVGRDITFDLAVIKRFGCTVHAFDPTVESARFVNDSVLPPTFHFHQTALGAQDGLSGFQTLKASPTYLAGTLVANDSPRSKPVPVRRVGSVMQELGHDRISLLKLDIEGGEYEVIEDLLASALSVEQLAIEFHPHIANLTHHGHMLGRHGWRRTEQAVQALASAGYRCFAVSRRGTELSFIRDV